MAVRIQYDPAQLLLWITFAGELDDAHLVRTFESAHRWTGQRNIRRGMLDGRALTLVSIPSETIRALAHRRPMLPQDSDRAIVTSQDFFFGLARMYQIMGGESRERLRICRTLEEAFEYLQIEQPKNLEHLEEF